MDDRVRRIRAEISRLRHGRPPTAVRYPRALRQHVTAIARRRRAAGANVPANPGRGQGAAARLAYRESARAAVHARATAADGHARAARARARVLVVSRQPRASQRSSAKGLPNQAALIRRALGEQHVSATAEGVNFSDDGPADVPPRESVVAGIPEAVDAPAGDPRGPLMAEPRPMGRTARRRARRCVLFVTVGILAVVLLASVVVIILEA